MQARDVRVLRRENITQKKRIHLPGASLAALRLILSRALPAAKDTAASRRAENAANEKAKGNGMRTPKTELTIRER